jgi:hypothetical protein
MEIYTCYGDKAPVGPNFSKGCIRENVKKILQNQLWKCNKGYNRGFMMFNTSLSNISVISWQSVLLVEETCVPGENH